MVIYSVCVLLGFIYQLKAKGCPFVDNWACGSFCRYWADIDTQLRRVAYEKRVKVRLLISCWANTQPLMFPFLKSLASVYDLKSKLDIQVVGGSSAFQVGVGFQKGRLCRSILRCIFYNKMQSSANQRVPVGHFNWYYLG